MIWIKEKRICNREKFIRLIQTCVFRKQNNFQLFINESSYASLKMLLSILILFQRFEKKSLFSTHWQILLFSHLTLFINYDLPMNTQLSSNSNCMNTNCVEGTFHPTTKNISKSWNTLHLKPFISTSNFNRNIRR